MTRISDEKLNSLVNSSKLVEFKLNIATRVYSIDLYGNGATKILPSLSVYDKLILPDSPGNKVYFYDIPLPTRRTGYISFTVPESGITLDVISKKGHKLRQKLGRDLIGITSLIKVKKGHYIVEYDT
jgi:hypothetical protein